MNNIISTLLAVLAIGSTLGCGTTVRTMTARSWILPPGSGGADAAPAPNEAPPVEAATDGEAARSPAVVTTPAARSGVASRYYVTYWEGSCRSVLGCGAGSSHVKRCAVESDNSVRCTDLTELDKVLNPL